MRWFTRRRPPAPLSVAIDRVDPATLEVVEIDPNGELSGPPPSRTAAEPREIGYAPRDRDPTGLAGVWEAIARS
jgi:hypothetical protein